MWLFRELCGGRKKAIFGVIWMERNRRVFEDGRVEELGSSWERVRFLASLWAEVFSEFRDSSFFAISSNQRGIAAVV